MKNTEVIESPDYGLRSVSVGEAYISTNGNVAIALDMLKNDTWKGLIVSSADGGFRVGSICELNPLTFREFHGKIILNF